MVSKKIVTKLAKQYNINLDVISIELLQFAINEEHEHRDIIGDDPEAALRIALAHLNEFPDYYTRLQKMVDQAHKYWAKKTMPSIYNK